MINGDKKGFGREVLLARSSSVEIDVPFLVGFSVIFSVGSDLIDAMRRKAD